MTEPIWTTYEEHNDGYPPTEYTWTKVDGWTTLIGTKSYGATLEQLAKMHKDIHRIHRSYRQMSLRLLVGAFYSLFMLLAFVLSIAYWGSINSVLFLVGALGLVGIIAATIVYE